MILESAIERHLVARVTAIGGIAEKVQVIGRRGFFDRLVALPGGRVIFCEVKKPKGGRMSAHQRERSDRYRRLGCEVVMLKTLADVDFLIDHCPSEGVQIPAR
jgi:hypothetical protein